MIQRVNRNRLLWIGSDHDGHGTKVQYPTRGRLIRLSDVIQLAVSAIMFASHQPGQKTAGKMRIKRVNRHASAARFPANRYAGLVAASTTDRDLQAQLEERLLFE